MKNATLAVMVVRITGLIQLALGLITWMGQADVLIPYHISIGLVLVIALLFLSYLAFRAGVSTGMLTLVVIWALILPVWGLIQQQLLPEAGHWIIQVSHLLCGVGAIGLAEMLSGKISKKSAAVAR